MRKNKSRSPVRPARIKKETVITKHRKIDYSDIPALSDAQLRAMQREGHPTR